MGRPPKPGEVRPPRKGNQGRKPGPFQHGYSMRLSAKGHAALIAERKALQELVDRGQISALEASYSVIFDRALLSHYARSGTAAGAAEDEAYLLDLRSRWRSEAPAPAPTASSTDLRAMVRAELASALQGELPGLLRELALAGKPAAKPKTKAAAKKPKK